MFTKPALSQTPAPDRVAPPAPLRSDPHDLSGPLAQTSLTHSRSVAATGMLVELQASLLPGMTKTQRMASCVRMRTYGPLSFPEAG